MFRMIGPHSCDSPRATAREEKRQLPSPSTAVTRTGCVEQITVSFPIAVFIGFKKSINPKVFSELCISVLAAGDTETEASGILYKIPKDWLAWSSTSIDFAHTWCSPTNCPQEVQRRRFKFPLLFCFDIVKHNRHYFIFQWDHNYMKEQVTIQPHAE